MNEVNVNRLKNFVEGLKFRFLEAMDDLVRIRNKEGEILFENKAMADLMEKSFINHTKHIKSSDLFFELYNHKDDVNTTMVSELKLDGKIYQAKASPIFDEKGEIEGYIEVYRDISLERNINKELVETRNKISSDIKLAKNIQRSILPKKRSFKNIGFQFAHIASDQLSGDVFDVVEIDRDKFGVYIADVVGHGISASIMTMFIRQSMRRILQENHDFSPEETVLELKAMFRQLDLDISQYFSIIYMLIDTKEKTLKYVNAGHNTYPIHFNDEKVEFMENKGKFISNLFKDVSYVEKSIDLVDGDKIIMYTDGLTDTVNEYGEYFDENHIFQWIEKNKDKKNIVEKLIRDLDKYRFEDQTDDIAIVCLEVRSR